MHRARLNGEKPLFIFDMGGVVVKSFHCVNAMAASLSLTTHDFFAISASRPTLSSNENPYNVGLIRLLQEGRITEQTFWEQFQENAANTLPHINLKIPYKYLRGTATLWGAYFYPQRDPAVWAILEQLKNRGYPLVCGTNTLEAHYRYHLQQGDYRIFDRVYASHEMGFIKPDQSFWEHILQAEGVHAKQAYFIDDVEENVRAAELLGLTVHHFRDASCLKEALTAQGYL